MSVLWYRIASGAPGPVAMYEQGIILPVTLTGPGRSIATTAMWDTGSQISSADQALLLQVGAIQDGSVGISTVQGPSTVPSYLASISIASGTYPLSGGPIPVLGDSLPSPPRVLVGRDIAADYRLTVDGRAGTFSVEAVESGGIAPQVAASRARVGVIAAGLLLMAVGVYAFAEAAA